MEKPPPKKPCPAVVTTTDSGPGRSQKLDSQYVAGLSDARREGFLISTVSDTFRVAPCRYSWFSTPPCSSSLVSSIYAEVLEENYLEIWTKKNLEAVRKFSCLWDVSSQSFKVIRVKGNAWKCVVSEVIIFLVVWLASIIKSMNESKLIYRLEK